MTSSSAPIGRLASRRSTSRPSSFLSGHISPSVMLSILVGVILFECVASSDAVGGRISVVSSASPKSSTTALLDSLNALIFNGIASTQASPAVETPDAALQKLEASKVPLNIAFAGLALYSLIGLLTLVAMIFPPQRVTPTRQSQIVQRLFSVMVILFCLLRLVYFCFPIAHVGVNVTYIINQLAFMVFFTMFSLIIFFWAEQYHRKFYDTQSMLPRLRNVFIVVNLLLWLLEIVLVTLAVVLNQVPNDRLDSDPAAPFVPTFSPPVAGSPILTDMKQSFVDSSLSGLPSSPMLTPSTNTKGAGLGGPVYFSSVILVIVVDFIFATGFAIYGIAIFVQKYTYALGSGLRRELIQTMIVTIIFAACFALRMIMFLYRPVTGKFLNGTLYRVLAYFIPEVVAVTLQVSVVYIMNHSSSSGAQSGWKRSNRSTGGFGAGTGGSIQRPSVEDDVYYAADQDLRASAMPAPIANAHERLISPPRPLRSNFSSSSSSASQGQGGTSNNANGNGINTHGNNINNTLNSSTVSSMQSNPSSSIPTLSGSNAAGMTAYNPAHNASAAGASSSVSPTRSGLPMAIASHQTTRIGIGSPPGMGIGGRSFSPMSFSPTHEQPLGLRSRPSNDTLPLSQHDHDHDSNEHHSSSTRNQHNGTTDEDSDALEIDDTASLIPKRHSRRH